MLIYALITEILQDEMGLGRSLEFFDLMADSIGFLLGYLIYRLLRNSFAKYF